MKSKNLILLLIAFLLTACTPDDGPSVRLPSDCPVTQPQSPPFTPPKSFTGEDVPGFFWYGSEALWTALPDDGTWAGLPANPEGYTQKLLFWREGYDYMEEPQPAITISAQRLDGNGESFVETETTNAFSPEIDSAMLVGVSFPSLGCWQVTGQYAGDQLTYIVWLPPSE